MSESRMFREVSTMINSQAFKMARKYESISGITKDDMAGDMALEIAKAMKRFNPEKASWRTYANSAIMAAKKEIRREVARRTGENVTTLNNKDCQKCPICRAWLEYSECKECGFSERAHGEVVPMSRLMKNDEAAEFLESYKATTYNCSLNLENAILEAVGTWSQNEQDVFRAISTEIEPNIEAVARHFYIQKTEASEILNSIKEKAHEVLFV